jgi:hypothetical protein
MDHRLFAVLAIICFALGGAGCVSESQRENRDEILMPLQTGSTIQRRVMVEREASVKKPKKKKEKKEKRSTPKPSPSAEQAAPEAPKPTPKPEEETAQPERFR